MSTTTVPAWLAPAYARAAVAAGATAPAADIDAAADRLIERWREPERRYHDLAHLVDLLKHVDELQQETHQPHHVRLAAWYHGAVFDADESAAYAGRGGEDEAASAEVAREDLQSLGVPQQTAEAVASMVEGLARHAATGDGADAAVLSDADLAILASDPQRYRDYLQRVREEYAHIPQDRYLEARRRIVEKLLSRERLYTSPMGGTWERPARENLTAERSRLTRELASLDQLSTDSDGPARR